MGIKGDSRGVSLVEVITAIAVLGIAIPPIVAVFREVAQHTADDTYQSAAIHAGNSLMEEIVSKAFEDPDLASGSFGTEEATQRVYDDIDDFDGYASSPAVPAPADPVLTAADAAPIGSTAPVGGDGVVSEVSVDASIFTSGESSPYGGIQLTASVDNVTGADTDPAVAEPDGSTRYKRVTVVAAWTSGGGGELRLKTLRTSPPDAAIELGPIDTKGSAGSAQPSLLSLNYVLINRTDTPLLIDTFKVEADRFAPPVAHLKVRQNSGSTYYLWAGYRPLPTPDVSPNQWSSAERSVPPNGTMQTDVGFLWPPSPGPITFTVTYTFADGSVSVLTMPMEWL